MSGRKFAIIDPAAGISGDMLLGALIDAGAPAAWLTELPARLGLPDVTVEVGSAMRCGLRASRVTVRSPGGVEVPADADHVPAAPDEHAHGHGHRHGEHSPHRQVRELLERIEHAPLSPWVRERALAAFRLIADAEGRIHGVPPERVALHEVGAWDALVDVVGSIEGFERLGVSEVYSWPAALGKGWVRAAHGMLAVPTPATLLLAEGLNVSSAGPVTGEATTPTGAALLRVLSEGAPPGDWRLVRCGWGAGTRDPAEYPNALRLLLAETAAEAGEVVVLATDVDDLSPEYLEPLREALTAAGALDVQTWATQMKKGRIGFRIEALAPANRADAVAEAFFRHSTTTGLRRWTAERRTLTRRATTVAGPEGRPIRVKTVEAPDGPRAKPEFDDVAAAARRTGHPAHLVAREYHDAALRQLRAPAAGTVGPPSATKESE